SILRVERGKDTCRDVRTDQARVSALSAHCASSPRLSRSRTARSTCPSSNGWNASLRRLTPRRTRLRAPARLLRSTPNLRHPLGAVFERRAIAVGHAFECVPHQLVLNALRRPDG